MNAPSPIRLNPESLKNYAGRGFAYLSKGDNDRAIADFTEAARLVPTFPYAFVGRGLAYRLKGDNDRAIDDYNEAIRLDPTTALAYVARGRSYLFAGSVDQALADFNEANKQDPKDAYAALWVDIARQRNNLPGRLAQTSSPIDMTVWPAPVIRLFMDQITPAAVMAAADDPNPAKKKDQICEAIFYSGELSLTKGSKDEATRLFRQVASDCPQTSLEVDAANAELKALGVAP
jgi:lipoprotein NlpI